MFIALFLTTIFAGCGKVPVIGLIDVINRTDTPNPFNNSLFANYETYQSALQELDEVDSMTDTELEDFLFSEDYRVHTEFLPYIDEYEQLKEWFTGESTIRGNIKFVMTDLENIATEADFREFKDTDRLKGIAGECRWKRLDNEKPVRLIKIDYTFWVLSSSLNQMKTIFHELGHCDLDRTDEPDDTPSLMAYKGRIISDFKNDRLPKYRKTRLYQELFDFEKMNNNEYDFFRRYEEDYFSNN